MKALAACLLAGLVLVPGASADRTNGERLYQQTCAQCHGLDGHGVKNQGPALLDAGAAGADFYLSTGRMPLDHPTEPVRSEPAYTRAEIADLVEFVASLGPGPAIPTVDLASASVSDGQQLFAQYCAGCHQIQARGGVVTGAVAPALHEATPVQIAEAVRTGPFVMPSFGDKLIDTNELDSIISYIEYTKHPDNRGGWSLASLGPIPEGMIAWLVGALSLVILSRVLGKRTEE
jgi:ubiquinol-cytochrome c reductase cytochrome c subunit